MSLLALLMPLASSVQTLRHVSDAHTHITHQNIAAATSTISHSPPRQMQQAKEEQYEILPSAAILDRMQKLVAGYPTFASLTTTQEWFGLPRAGEFDIAVKILNDIDGHIMVYLFQNAFVFSG